MSLKNLLICSSFFFASIFSLPSLHHFNLGSHTNTNRQGVATVINTLTIISRLTDKSFCFDINEQKRQYIQSLIFNIPMWQLGGAFCGTIGGIIAGQHYAQKVKFKSGLATRTVQSGILATSIAALAVVGYAAGEFLQTQNILSCASQNSIS